MKHLNNPLNIRYCESNRWLGLLANDRGFCTFVTIDYGVRAALYLLMVSYRRLGLKTVRQIIGRWAPRSENPTDRYISFISQGLCISPDIPLTKFQYFQLVILMWKFEQGSLSHGWSLSNVVSCCKKFKIRFVE